MSQMFSLLKRHTPKLATIVRTKHHQYRTNPAIQFILDEANSIRPTPPPPPPPPPPPSPSPSQNDEALLQKRVNKGTNGIESSRKVEISHPWPEWVALMDKLLKDGYFEGIGHPFACAELGPKAVNQIRTACLNFARDRYELIRYLSCRDIFVVAESGCPSIDRKIVNSGKRLRAQFGIDEGNVCSSCIVRGSCERAFVKAREDEGGRTVDVMRLLVAYGLDPVIGSVDNTPCLNKKVKESARILLKEMVEFDIDPVNCQPVNTATVRSKPPEQGSADGETDVLKKQGDWTCPKCNFLNFGRNIKCLRCDGLFQERLAKLREEQEHLPLKKGDWICEKCNFLNFAKNSRCLQCKENPPKRDLIPGEWECDSCNYINFRRNMVCLKCGHRRPKASNRLSPTSQSASDNTGHSRTRPMFGEVKQSKEDGCTMWKCDESENELPKVSKPPYQILGFMDFPVVGGKSDLSQDLQRRERWRLVMEMERKNATKARENADDLKYSMLQKDCESFECTDDDEEMEDWFYNRKSRTVQHCESTTEDYN